MKKALLYGASFAAVAAVALVPATDVDAAEKKVFKDVKQSGETGEAIYSMVERGIISGYTDGTFKPNAPITYGQVAKILAGALNFSYDEIINPNYEDIPTTHASYKYIAALHNTGIFQGATAWKFKPSTVLTRGKMADILWRAYDLKGEGTTPFTDLKSKEQQRLAMLLYVNDITKGINATQFGPNKPVTRAQLCLFIYRIEQKMAKGEIQLDGPTANVFVSSDEQVISYTDITGKEIDQEEYTFTDYIPGTKILIHGATETGRYILKTKNSKGFEFQHGVVTDYRNNQYKSYNGNVYTDNYTLFPKQLEGYIAIYGIVGGNEDVEVLSVDVKDAVKGYKKRVVTFGDAIIDDKVTLPILNEGHTVIQVVYKVGAVTKTKNVHLAVYKMNEGYLVTEALHMEEVK